MTLNLDKPLLRAMSYSFLVASSFCCCCSIYNQQKHLSLGILPLVLCFITGLYGTWIYTQILLRNHANNIASNIFQVLKFLTNIYALPLVIGDMYLKYELSVDLVIAHLFLPILGLVPCGVIKREKQTPEPLTIRDKTIIPKYKLRTPKLKLTQYVDSMDFVTFVRYTGFRDRPQEERQVRFQSGCRDGHTEIAFAATGTNLQLVFTVPNTGGYAQDRECDFDKEHGKVHIRSSFIMNGVCVRWRGWIDLERLDGVGCLEFCEERAAVEDQLLREQIDRYNQRLREFEDKQRVYRGGGAGAGAGAAAGLAGHQHDRSAAEDLELRMSGGLHGHGHHGHHGASPVSVSARCHGPTRHGLPLQVGMPLTPP